MGTYPRARRAGWGDIRLGWAWTMSFASSVIAVTWENDVRECILGACAVIVCLRVSENAAFFFFLFFTVINVENKESGVKKISFETASLFVCLVRTAHNFVLQKDGGNCSSSSSIAFDTESVKCSVFIRAAAPRCSYASF